MTRDQTLITPGNPGEPVDPNEDRVHFHSELANGDPLPPEILFDPIIGRYLISKPQGLLGTYLIAVTIFDRVPGTQNETAYWRLTVGDKPRQIMTLPSVPSVRGGKALVHSFPEAFVICG